MNRFDLLRRRFGLLLAGVWTAVPAPLLAQGSEGGGLFDVNPGLMVWATVVFIFLFLILRFLAWDRLLGAVDAREERIQGALDESAEAQEEGRRLLAEHRAQLADARRQANELIAQGKTAGERLRKEIEEKARTEGQGIIESARREIERERDLAIAELRRESVDLALAAAAKLMHEKLDDASDRKIVVDYLDGLSGGAEA